MISLGVFGLGCIKKYFSALAEDENSIV